ncbi:hypothetical protein AMIS_59370 [Actinoplanes missouriensis 431]|uniref:Lipoprotein n=1 Tax=Actinoplanes missouriensis (strain ATCC 14538 / DSM 43046 / CBS 188.64 / JCM 3121 / NBRC 102363 / NCIMB 12654 / NRRL B-3342 / UNCC 431) TaxID=512565 RepID=I0HDS0_ACTM4|nr:hypothetical protein [Actinoplanes missouriensis]BAL91157.1 hypothetical protein AMIS_59370 [Actinoplanes missouriensis 431]
MNVRIMRGGVALAMAAALALSGCAGNDTSGGDSGGDTKAAESTKEPAAALVDAANKLQQESFKAVINMGDQGTMNGVMDPVKKTGEFILEAESEGTDIKTEMRIVDGANYIRITMPGSDIPGMDGKTWRKLNGAGGTGTIGAFDATDTVRSLEAATDVKWAGDDTVTGTIDLSKAGKQLGMGAADVEKLGAKTVPFEAGIDGEGRLTKYTLTIPAVGTQPEVKMDMTYSDFGVPVDIKAPAASEIVTS